MYVHKFRNFQTQIRSTSTNQNGRQTAISGFRIKGQNNLNSSFNNTSNNLNSSTNQPFQVQNQINFKTSPNDISYVRENQVQTAHQNIRNKNYKVVVSKLNQYNSHNNNNSNSLNYRQSREKQRGHMNYIRQLINEKRNSQKDLMEAKNSNLNNYNQNQNQGYYYQDVMNDNQGSLAELQGYINNNNLTNNYIASQNANSSFNGSMVNSKIKASSAVKTNKLQKFNTTVNDGSPNSKYVYSRQQTAVTGNDMDYNTTDITTNQTTNGTLNSNSMKNQQFMDNIRNSNTKQNNNNSNNLSQNSIQQEKQEIKKYKDYDENHENQKLNQIDIVQKNKGSQEDNNLLTVQQQILRNLTSLEYFQDGPFPQILDLYEIGSQIGKGSYAIVVYGKEKRKKYEVAIKRYQKKKLMEPGKMRNVRREVNILCNLSHPNVMKLYTIIDSDEHLNLVMELIQGVSLYTYLKARPQRRLPEDKCRRVFTQVVQGIQYLHKKRIVHRDIKLENLLIDEKKKVKIIDFGFSVRTAENQKLTSFCGTPSYMSPEIVSKKEYTGFPSDIWSLGILLFVLLCGCFPFRGENEKDLFIKIRKGKFDIPNHVPIGARILIQKILKVEESERPLAQDILEDNWIKQGQHYN